METISEQKCFHGIQGVYRHRSECTGTDMRFAVFLPPAADSGKVPVLWYLSGLTCTEENFTVKAGAQRYAAEREIVRNRPRNAGNANERGTPIADQNGPAYNHLYHGAKGNVQAVLDTGPMARFSVPAGGHQGTWTCENASYSCSPGYAPTKQVFACRAVLGTPGNDRTFDCHGQPGQPVFVFWSDSAVYTEYLFQWR